MTRFPRNPRSLIVVALSLLFFFALIFNSSFSLPSLSSAFSAGQRITPANATLGFGHIYVVSAQGSSRRDHLEQAAAVTELDLEIPVQKQWTEQDILEFRRDNLSESIIGVGSVMSWLGHRNAIQHFLDNSAAETALIIEDDVDFDIRLRTLQVPLAQRAAHDLLQPRYQDPRHHPWGRPSSWDLLYLGHCGDYWRPVKDGIGLGHHHPEQLNRIPHTIWHDDSVPHYSDLHPYTASLLVALRIPEHSRILHKSTFPLCSFAYAITRRGASRILSEVAPATEKVLPDPAYAFDVALLNGCVRDAKLNCYSLQPELFHHMSGDSAIGLLEGGKHFMAPVDEAGSTLQVYRMETSNIGCGFWSGEFYYDGDIEKLERLRREVGRKGRCLKAPRPGL